MTEPSTNITFRPIRYLLTEAEEAGKPVRIHVERFNPAMRLYERLGFTQVDDQGVYYLMEWSPPAGRH
ncbi:MAG: GNAT family N-acetyltransferase [bacterium]|nr:GNAT family N-acetyltransferase [bacterium]